MAAVDMRANTGWCDALSFAKALRRLDTPCAEKSCMGRVKDVSPRKLNSDGSRSSACVCMCVCVCVHEKSCMGRGRVRDVSPRKLNSVRSRSSACVCVCA